MASLRGMQQPELSKKLFKLIKSENHAIGAYEAAARERVSIASQLSDWGEATNDDGISDVSDKLGVLLAEVGESEESFAQNLEDYRAVLKTIRNMERSVQPSRDQKQKTMDEIAKLKHKEPESAKLPVLEQQLVREEAQNLVAEAQLTNIVRCAADILLSLHIASFLYYTSPFASIKHSKHITPLTPPTDPPKTQRSLRPPLRRRDRARRKTNHPSPPRTTPPEPARRHARRAGRRAADLRARRAGPPGPQRRRRGPARLGPESRADRHAELWYGP